MFIPGKVDESSSRKVLMVIDFHVGGFVLRSCLEQARFCAKLARELICVFVSVDYRIGLVSKHRAALEDG